VSCSLLFSQLARYLAVSGRVLTAHDLYMLGLVTHIVDAESPADQLVMTLNNSSSTE
jgi:enoyl-CoA hydratase/carnithine racemase